MFRTSARMTWTRAVGAGALTGLAFIAVSATEGHPPNTGMADPDALVNAFDRFLAAGEGNELVLSLSNLRGMASESLNAGGRVRIDLATGVVTSTVELLPPGGAFDLWLIDNRPGLGHTTLAEPSDVSKRVGPYVAASGAHTLSVTLGPAAFSGFFPDRAFVVRSGQNPVTSFVLTGPSTLFDRLRRRQVRFVGDRCGGARVSIPIGHPSRELREARRSRPAALSEREFNGNGRTCGTCHVESNNFTIDPEFISTLPAQRSAVRGGDQSRAGDARESRPAAPVRTDPRERGRVRSGERVCTPRHSNRAGAGQLDDASGSELRHRLQHQRAKPRSARAPGLGQRRRTAARFRPRRHRAARTEDAEPHARRRFPRADG